MKRSPVGVALLALCFLLVASLASALPVNCSTTPPNNNLIAENTPTNSLSANPGDVNEPCVIGQLTFSNFSYDLDTGSFTTVNPTVSTINAGQVGSTATLEFNPNLAVGSDLELEYQVSGGLLSAQLSFNGGGTGFVNEVVCTVFNANGTSCPMADELAILNVNSAGASATIEPGCVGCTSSNAGGVATINLGAVASEVWIFKDINSGNAPFSEVTQSYLVPEPMTLSLFGAGLLGLGLLRRHLRK